jgi:hypothetical protein
VSVESLGLWFEDRMNQLDAWRLRRNAHRPELIEKPYWHNDALASDAARLESLGYAVESEADNSRYVSATYPANTGGGFGQLSRTVTRRVPSIHVTYRLEPEHPAA